MRCRLLSRVDVDRIAVNGCRPRRQRGIAVEEEKQNVTPGRRVDPVGCIPITGIPATGLVMG